MTHTLADDMVTMVIQPRPAWVATDGWTSPYKGLVPYDIRDEPLFFGRTEDRRVIATNLRTSRLTLVFGASGVGKSSLLRAGVAADLQAQIERNLRRGRAPGHGVVIFAAWKDD